MPDRRTSLLGVPVDVYAPDELLSELGRALRLEGAKTVFAINSEKIMLARGDTDLLTALQGADFLIPDGIGAVIGLTLLRGKRAARIAGIDLMGRLLDVAERSGHRVFLFGAKPDVVRDAALRSLERRPSLNIVGHKDGYIRETEYGRLVEEINGLETDILFVGLGSPKQEKWLHEHKPLLEARICMGVGGSMEVLSGRSLRAPRWLQTVGLEWLYRFLKEPARFWKRIVRVFRYAFAVLKEIIASPEPGT
ncbi:MAG: WecB/TagA/CpsF family glycosyltransferase [Candidatus Aminicenantales bacterium]